MREFGPASGGLVLLLQAPAGFGKTHALAEWARRAARRGSQLAWLTLTSTERDYAALSGALTQALPFASSDQLPPEPRSRARLLARLIRDRKQPVCLVIDNLERAESDANVALLQSFLEHLPDNLTLAFATRAPTRLAVSRLLLEGRLRRFDRSHLAFTPAEIKEFFGGSLLPAQLKSVRAVTEGWPAALRIADICRAAWRAAGVGLESVSMFVEQLDEYVASEVLADLGDPLVELLVASSIVDPLTSPLAEAITRMPDCAERFDALVSAHGILRASDTQPAAYSLPALLRRSLQRRLAKRGLEHVHMLHSRAAAWYERSDHLREAVEHYVASGRPDEAAAAMERAGALTVAVQEGDDRAAAIMRLLPDAIVDATPRLGLCRVFLDYKRGFLAESSHRYAELSRLTDAFTHDRAGGDDIRLRLEAAFIDLVMQVYRRSHVSKEFLRSMERRLTPDAQGNLQVLLTVQVVLGMLYRLRGDLELAASAFVEAEKLSGKLGSPWMMIWLRHHFGSLALARGQLHEAKYQLQTGLKMWRSHFHQERSYRALTDILLAEAEYEMNGAAEAQARIDEAMYSAEHVEGWYDIYASLYGTAVRLCLQDDAPERAETLIARAEGIERIRELLGHFIPAMRAHIALRTGDLTRAQSSLAKVRLPQIWDDPDSIDQLSCRDWDLIGATLCHLAIAGGELHRAEEILDRAYQMTRLSGRLRSQAHVLLLRAEVSRRRGERRKATQYFAQALQIGKAQGYCRTFLDEGVILRELIALSQASPDLHLPSHLSAFAMRLAGALPGAKQFREPEGPFSSREREVIQELGLGHSNKLIARKLGLSEPTVKFHVQNIFRKLQVRKRASAVVEAHRRGLLA